MVWRMLFADLRALIAHIGAQRTELFGQWGNPAHPATGHRADIRTFPAQPQTPLHELHIALMLHSDHVVRALIADLRATKTGCDTIFPFRCQRFFILMHGVSFPNLTDSQMRHIVRNKKRGQSFIATDSSSSLRKSLCFRSGPPACLQLTSTSLFTLSADAIFLLSVPPVFSRQTLWQAEEGVSPT